MRNWNQLGGSVPTYAWVNQNVMCTQYVVKHNLVLDGMLI